MAYEESIKELQKHVVNNNLTRVKSELAFLYEKVQTRNKNFPRDPWSMSEVLSRTFSTLDHKSITPLEYAVLEGRTEIAASLRSYSAPETPNTAWAPNFWNFVFRTSPTPALSEESKTPSLNQTGG